MVLFVLVFLEHPQKVITLKSGIENAALDFELNAARDHRIHSIKLLAEQVVDPGHNGARVCRKKIDDRLLNIGQSRAGMHSLQRKMSRKAPECFFTFEPYAVNNLIEKTPFALHA